MKKTILVLGVLAALAACEQKQSSKTAEESYSASTSSVSKEDVCPGGIGSTRGDQPKLSVKTPIGNTLILCGYEESKKTTEGKKNFSEFDVYSVDASGKVSAPILTVSALEHYSAQEASGKLSLDELVWFQEEWHSAFRSEIECSTKECVRSKEKCIFVHAKKFISTHSKRKKVERLDGGDVEEYQQHQDWAKRLSDCLN